MGFLSLFGRISLDASDWHAKIRSTKASVTDLKANLAKFVTLSSVAFKAKSVIDYASGIQDMSERTGVGVERLQELDFALKQSGSSAEGAQKAFIKLGEARREALKNPGSKEAKEFKLLGISSTELAALRDGGDLFLRLSDALQNVKVDSNSIPIVLDLIGKKNAEVLPAMAAGLRESAAEARRLNQVLSVETIESLDDVGDKITAMSGAATKPIAKMIEIFLTGLDSIQIAIQRIGLAAVETMDWLAQHHPFGTKKMKEESKLLAESVREEFETNYNAFLDRHDPEVLAEKRVEKRKREERKREFGLDEIKVADTPAVHAEKRGFLISDSLTQIGNFLGQSVNTPQLKQLSEQTILLRRIEQNTGKKMGVDFPL